MADTLAALTARASAEPERLDFLSRERVKKLRELFASRSQPPSLNERFMLARELLASGDSRGAIAELEGIQRDARIVPDARFPQNKPVFDLLAVSYFRLAEQENCNVNPAVSVCQLGELHHMQQEGARRAIDVYEEILRAFPDDVGSRWLLNLAYMAVGGYPSRVPSQWLIPDLTRRRDASFPRFQNVAARVGADVTGLAGGLCIDDFNRDGLLDLFTTSWGLTDAVHLLLADGKGGYVDRTKAAGLDRITGGIDCVHADYDNDGNDDILVLRGGWLGDAGAQPNSLLRNLGDGTFEDVTFAAGIASVQPTHSAAWADFNLDGYLDLFVGNESSVASGGSSHPSQLYLNNRNGTFTEVAPRVGIDLDAFVKGVVWGDVNNDGLPDLYVSVFDGPNHLYMNRGGASIDQWHFEDVAAALTVDKPYRSFPTWIWDYDNDGWEDIIVFGYDLNVPLHEAVAREYIGHGAADTGERTYVYRNAGHGTFVDATPAAGLADKAIYAMGSNFGDLDNDGWLDFYAGTGNPDPRSVVPNRMFHSVDGKRFEEVTLEGGFGLLQKGHGAAFADLDRDGDEDIFMVLGGAYEGDTFTSVLYENPGWRNRHWVTLELEGRAANRSAIGARVEIVAEDASGAQRTIRRTVGTGGSFGAGPLQLHVGLGDAKRIAFVHITWPDSARTRTTDRNLEVDAFYRIVQGQCVEQLERPPVPFRRPASH